MRLVALVSLVLFASSSSVHADILVSDDFEGSLGQWIGKGGGAHSAAVVPDPLNPSNNVVRFQSLNFGGDIFSVEVPIVPGQLYILSFDYLGLAVAGSPAGSFGGFIGICDETESQPLDVMKFLAGTCNENNILIDIVDDGAWHSYSLVIDPSDYVTISDQHIRIMLEDWGGEVTAECPAGVIGDAYFDNVRFESMGTVSARESTWGRVKALYR